jgi:predicted transcriptional regulator
MITDRDIAVRAVAAGLGPETPVEDVMTEGVCYCFEDQDIREVTNNMKEIKVRRLPVINRENRLVGIIAHGDIVRSDGHGIATAQALAGICQPGGMHSQSGESDSDVTSIG